MIILSYFYINIIEIPMEIWIKKNIFSYLMNCDKDREMERVRERGERGRNIKN